MAFRRRHIFWVVSPLVVIVGAYVALTWGTRFDSQAWKDAKNDPWLDRRRAKMVDSLLAKYPLKGMRRIEVEALLGTPETDPKPLWGRLDLSGATVYRLGFDGFIDSDWMILLWTPDDVVSEVRIVNS